MIREGKVVAYAWHVEVTRGELTDSQLGVAAMVFGLRIWRYYLDGTRFEVFSDSQDLKYLFD